mmetsp:Transcript_23749/g.53598  ORF Transcript_23749/g.53598 Transcript_23749/m.53598 type:complete len:255 (-) Transcript_23749:489-1253(-)
MVILQCRIQHKRGASRFPHPLPRLPAMKLKEALPARRLPVIVYHAYPRVFASDGFGDCGPEAVDPAAVNQERRPNRMRHQHRSDCGGEFLAALKGQDLEAAAAALEERPDPGVARFGPTQVHRGELAAAQHAPRKPPPREAPREGRRARSGGLLRGLAAPALALGPSGPSCWRSPRGRSDSSLFFASALIIEAGEPSELVGAAEPPVAAAGEAERPQVGAPRRERGERPTRGGACRGEHKKKLGRGGLATPGTP